VLIDGVVSLLVVFLLSGEAPAAAQTGQVKARAAIEQIIRDSGAEVAVAFRTLDRPAGEAARLELLLQPDVEFHAASTMKVPVMIELFRQDTIGLAKLDSKVPVVNTFRSIIDDSPYTLSPDGDSETQLYTRIGQPISYRELCWAMITASSNLATNVLIDRLGVQKIQQTTIELGATGMQVLRGVEDSKAYEAGRNNTTTADALLVLMEAIARGKAVSPEASKEMVEILANQKFRDGIPAGVPEGTRVAHKTGEISSVNHDAAIVFAPRPYVLVVLVRGLESKAREALIAQISKTVYEQGQR
jgi:beta-lactamase class A